MLIRPANIFCYKIDRTQLLFIKNQKVGLNITNNIWSGNYYYYFISITKDHPLTLKFRSELKKVDFDINDSALFKKRVLITYRRYKLVLFSFLKPFYDFTFYCYIPEWMLR